jgi:hypothetical protein
VSITDCSISQVWGDFVAFERAIAHGPRCLRCTVTRLTATGTGRQGVSWVAADHCTVQDSTLNEIRRTAFDFEPSTAVLGDGITYAIAQRNTINRHKLNFVSSGGAIGSEVNHVLIDSNNIIGATTGSAIGHVDVGTSDGGTSRRSDWTFTNNTGTVRYGNSGTGLGQVCIFKQIDGVTVGGNTELLSKSQVMYFVDFQDCTSVTLTPNTLDTTGKTWAWAPGADGQARYKDASGTVTGYSP